jgi:hypothetical protein
MEGQTREGSMSNIVQFPAPGTEGAQESVKKEDVKELVKREATDWSVHATALAIVDHGSYQRAVELGQAGVTIEDRIKKTFGPLKTDAYALHKKLCDMEKSFLEPVQRGLDYLRKAARTWKDEQDRIAAERQRQAEEAARKASEEAKLLLAVQAEQAGASVEEVEATLNMELNVPAPVLPAAPKVEGVTSSGRWKAEVIDIRTLCRAVADGKVMAELVQPNMTLLNKLVTQSKSAFNIPGVKAVKETSIGFKKAQ